jgi:ABC-type antimicrobial peptide transport system permease subunit
MIAVGDRGDVDRRAELALLGALGFTGRKRLWLILLENAYLLLIGLAIGAGCGGLGMAPAIVAGPDVVNIGRLLATLAAIAAFGLASLAIAAAAVARHFAPADLHAE